MFTKTSCKYFPLLNICIQRIFFSYFFTFFYFCVCLFKKGQHWNFDAAVKDFKVLQGQRRLSAQRQAVPPPKTAPKPSPSRPSPAKPSSPQRSPPQKVSPQRNSPPNGQMVQPAPSRASPQMNGRGGHSTTQNGGGTSLNVLQHPKMRDHPKSPGKDSCPSVL